MSENESHESICGNTDLKQAVVSKTMVEYSGVSSLHGLQYIFESGRNLSISKVLWLLVVIAAAGQGMIWSNEGGSIINVLHALWFLRDTFKRDY